jgi:TonB family protein
MQPIAGFTLGWLVPATVAVTMLSSAASSAQTPASAPIGDDGSATLERKQREAVNPMRMIIEASKIKSRPRPGDVGLSPATAVPDAPGRSIARRETARTVAAAGSAASAPVATGAELDRQNSTIASPASAWFADQAPEGATSLAKESTSASNSLVESNSTALPTPLATRPIPTATESKATAIASAALTTMPAAVSQPLAPASQRPVEPKLLAYVAPDVSNTVLSRMNQDTEVQVRYTIERSGRTARAEIVGKPNRGLDRPALEAVAQWRFEAVDQELPRVVRILFKAPVD